MYLRKLTIILFMVLVSNFITGCNEINFINNDNFNANKFSTKNDLKLDTAIKNYIEKNINHSNFGGKVISGYEVLEKLEKDGVIFESIWLFSQEYLNK